MMKSRVIVQFMLIVAVIVVTVDADFSGFDSQSKLGSNSLQSLTKGKEANSLKNSMDGALNVLLSWKKANSHKKNESEQMNPISPIQNSSAINSSAMNSSIGHSPNISEDKANSGVNQGSSPPNREENGSAGLNGVNTNSRAIFNGYYGIIASRHEMGKSDISSKLSLNGAFDVDKTVKFSDRGF
jgi:hypothetical protein